MNNTGYLLTPEFLRTLLGKDAHHNIDIQSHGDHSVQAIFDDHVAGFSPYFPRFTFNVFGEFDVFAVPEPATWLLILIGAGMMGNFSRIRSRSQRSIFPSMKWG